MNYLNQLNSATCRTYARRKIGQNNHYDDETNEPVGQKTFYFIPRNHSYN
jgi:hypothetical protein